MFRRRDASADATVSALGILPARHAPDLAEFSPGATAYVEGHLARHGERQRTSIIAHRAWSIAPAQPAPEEERASGTHDSPGEHQRAGHARRVAIGTARERLIWVRPTVVRPGSPTSDSPTQPPGPPDASSRRQALLPPSWSRSATETLLEEVLSDLGERLKSPMADGVRAVGRRENLVRLYRQSYGFSGVTRDTVQAPVEVRHVTQLGEITRPSSDRMVPSFLPNQGARAVGATVFVVTNHLREHRSITQ